MTPDPVSEAELEGYLDEALPAEQMTALEQRLRSEPELLGRLAEINLRRDRGSPSLGSIWREHRLTCPSRQELGAFLLQALPDDHFQYLTFHLEVVGCRTCQASLEDLAARQQEAPRAAQTRQKKYFESSAGYLPKR